MKIIKQMRKDKAVVEINDQKYIIWQAMPFQIELLKKAKVVRYTPKTMFLDNNWVAQEWLHEAEMADINKVQHHTISDYHNLQRLDLKDDWLYLVDILWHKLSLQQQKSIEEYSRSWSSLRLELQTKAPLTGVLSHGDIHPGNIVISKGQLYFIDWEWCCIAPLEYDLAMIKQYQSKRAFDLLIDKCIIDEKLLLLCSNLCLMRCAFWALSQTKLMCHKYTRKTLLDYRKELKTNTFIANSENLSDLAASALDNIFNY